MKNVIMSLLAAILSVSAIAQKINTPTPYYRTPIYSEMNEQKMNTKMVTADRLNVRSTPSTRSAVIGKVSEGSVVKILEEGLAGNFVKVMYADGTDVKEGYVSNDYLAGIFITDRAFKGYVQAQKMSKKDLFQYEYTLYEVVADGRKEVLKSHGHELDQITLAISDVPQNDNIERIIAFERHETDCCYCGTHVTNLIKGKRADFLMKEYILDSEAATHNQLHIAGLWDQDEYDLALISGSTSDFESNQLDSVEFLQKFRFTTKNETGRNVTVNN